MDSQYLIYIKIHKQFRSVEDSLASRINAKESSASILLASIISQAGCLGYLQRIYHLTLFLMYRILLSIFISLITGGLK
jgi:hypothetical protein